MSLRDRIARTLHDISCSHLDMEVDWALECEDVRIRFYEDADAILADPEVAALREVAEAARLANQFVRHDIRCVSQPPTYSMDCDCGGSSAMNKLDAALARLEGTRK